MTWDFFTWVAIAVLIVVSIAVFVWFLADVRRIHAEMREQGGKDDW